MYEQRISRIREMEEIYDRVQKDLAVLKEYEETGAIGFGQRRISLKKYQ